MGFAEIWIKTLVQHARAQIPGRFSILQCERDPNQDAVASGYQRPDTETGTGSVGVGCID